MSGRVRIGAGRGSFGLWVSKPGFDVDTCGVDDLEVGLERQNADVLLSGTIAVATSPIVVPWSFAFTPTVVFSPYRADGAAFYAGYSPSLRCIATASGCTFYVFELDTGGFSGQLRLNWFALREIV